MRARRWHLRTFRVPARRVPSEPSSPYSPSNGTIEMSAPPNAFCSTRDHFCGSSPNHAAPSLCISCTTGVVPHVGVTRIISMGAPSIAHRSDPGRAYPGARRAEYSQSGMARCRSKRQKERGRPARSFNAALQSIDLFGGTLGLYFHVRQTVERVSICAPCRSRISRRNSVGGTRMG